MHSLCPVWGFPQIDNWLQSTILSLSPQGIAQVSLFAVQGAPVIEIFCPQRESFD